MRSCSSLCVCVKAGTVELKETAVARHGVGKHVSAAMNIYATVALLETVFSMQSASNKIFNM